MHAVCPLLRMRQLASTRRALTLPIRRPRPSLWASQQIHSKPNSSNSRRKSSPFPLSEKKPDSSAERQFSPHPPGVDPSPNQKLSRSSELPPDWDENPDYNIHAFSELPSSNFGVNQHILINNEFKEALRQILWQFRAPIRYAFAYGSGVFPQTPSKSSPGKGDHPRPTSAISSGQGGSGKMIDFVFGVSYTQHWHSLNLGQHRDHYSSLGALGSSAVSFVQDKWGAGVYFNPYVSVNGTLIKYGVANLDTICQDLSEWNTLYLAGRLHKPVKILRDDPRVRLANQVNLLSALRTAMLLLPAEFTELELYETVAGISYLGDPRMDFGAENVNKVSNIVRNQLPNFRNLYAPLIENLPNMQFLDSKIKSSAWKEDPSTVVKLVQDMDPVKRGNMVRRLPKNFRKRLYFQYQSKYQIPQLEFNEMMEQSNDEDATQVKRRQGGKFEQRIASDEASSLKGQVNTALSSIIKWPSYSQSAKGIFTSGIGRSWRYMNEKRKRNYEGIVAKK